MKLCFVTEHFPPHIGGVETVFWSYAEALARLGHEIRVVTSNSGGITGTVQESWGSVSYLSTPMWFGHPLLTYKSLLPHADWADIVHTTTYTAALPALRAAKKRQKPCLLTVHEALGKRWFQVESNPFLASLFFAYERFVIKQPYSHWHVVSQATLNDVLAMGIPPTFITCIHHGIDPRLWSVTGPRQSLSKLFGLPNTQRVLLYNGRPGKTKGTTLLLQAIHRIQKKIPRDIVFGFIVTKNPPRERAAFEAHVARLALDPIVKIHDAVPQTSLPAYRRDAQAVVVPSLTEGFGFTAAETSALGVPVIASLAGALPEVVSGPHLFFETGSEAALAEALLLAIEGKFKNKPKNNFSWEASSNELEKLYLSLL